MGSYILTDLVWVSIQCESKMEKNKDLEQGKVDCRIQILELARSSSKKKQKRIRDE